jgi:transposase
MAQKKKWSPSAKFEIVLLAIKGETTLNDICKRYEVAPAQVHMWKKQFLEHGSEVFAKKNKAAKTAESELEQKQSQLYEKIGKLTVERDFLKKSWNKFQESDDDN